MLLAVFSQIFGGKDVDPAGWPGFADVEQCVLCLDMRVTPPGEDGKGTYQVGGRTPGLLKTTRPFDWAGMFRQGFPTAPARHAGRPYLQVTFQFPFLPVFLPPPFLIGYPDCRMAVYAPDDRTAVFGSEEQIQALLTRLTAGDPPPTPPPGWADVDRDAVALALDNRREPLVAGRFPADHPAGPDVGKLADALDALAVGLTIGDRTRVRLVATARDEDGGRAVADALRGLFALGAVAAPDADSFGTFGAALLGGADLRRDGRRVTGRLSAPGNVVRVLAAAVGDPD
jgi:hypothetical protein